MKVLVLEDDPLLQVDLAEMLEQMGHEVVGPFSAEGPRYAILRRVASGCSLR
ncbi:hypothetical protein [Roseovarius sp. C03]|uniref:hypothetical protein n=1 Tax=Roseovarius sp. C03 TaxID=3449222 RepID=UPI003EDC2A3B